MIANQVYVFFWSIGIGALLTLLFDFFRLFRRNNNIRDIAVYIQDILFMILAVVIIIISAFMTNSGELRGYMIMGYLVGGMLYLLLFSKIFLKTFGYLLDKLEYILHATIQFLTKWIKRMKITKKKNEI